MRAKNIDQQGILALHSARSLLVKQQTMLANAMRGLATEFGLTVPQGIGRLAELFLLVDADKAFPEKARQVFTALFEPCLSGCHPHPLYVGHEVKSVCG